MQKKKSYYSHILYIAIPMIIQNLITNFVSMLDNIMVGQIGTCQMSGVSIVNQFIFVFNISIFGAISGAGIFGCQFFGKQNHEGQKHTFRFRLLFASLICILGLCIFIFFGDNLIQLFLSKDDSPELIAQTLHYGQEYLSIIIYSLIPFAIGQVYCSVIRECQETKIPMYAALSALFFNLFLDYSLIFGKFGFPQLGVAGAAVATVIAKIIEAFVMIIWAHTHIERNKYLVGAYRHLFHIPSDLCKQMILKSIPLLMNEFLWSFGMSVIAQCYSVRGLEVVAARNIASTLTNLFGVVYIQFGSAAGILVGNKLGAGLFDEAIDDANHLMPFVCFVTAIVALIMVPVGIAFPKIYQTTATIKALASFIIIVQAIAMPFWSYANSSYFILRSGGKIGITILFDSGFTWLIVIPLSFILTRFTNLSIEMIVVLITIADGLKAITGYFLVKSKMWVNNIVN
ncbi:MATE family efflux transporter [Floccifex sp.]|uniref:MATE family efflux transporter n=1 Tax=Floccifex sp. TaxID=2815810 RepID=UPI002A76501B|nr:MATE family efflux transporter [Floccifex sp.]MDD7280599.1 MATE family efflux transporter [Erysipelotrichaceae bacterium]MDY2958875.1 MATE family efflux transporter [Floccifex sp.]